MPGRALSMCLCGRHVLCAAKGPSLEKFSTCHLFRHQLNLKSNQTKPNRLLPPPPLGSPVALHLVSLSAALPSSCSLSLSLSGSFRPLHVCQLVQYCPFSLCFSFVHLLLLVFFFSTSPAPPQLPRSVRSFSNNSCCFSVCVCGSPGR